MMAVSAYIRAVNWFVLPVRGSHVGGGELLYVNVITQYVSTITKGRHLPAVWSRLAKKAAER